MEKTAALDIIKEAMNNTKSAAAKNLILTLADGYQSTKGPELYSDSWALNSNDEIDLLTFLFNAEGEECEDTEDREEADRAIQAELNRQLNRRATDLLSYLDLLLESTLQNAAFGLIRDIKERGFNPDPQKYGKENAIRDTIAAIITRRTALCHLSARLVAEKMEKEAEENLKAEILAAYKKEYIKWLSDFENTIKIKTSSINKSADGKKAWVQVGVGEHDFNLEIEIESDKIKLLIPEAADLKLYEEKKAEIKEKTLAALK